MDGIPMGAITVLVSQPHYKEKVVCFPLEMLPEQEKIQCDMFSRVIIHLNPGIDFRSFNVPPCFSISYGCDNKVAMTMPPGAAYNAISSYPIDWFYILKKHAIKIWFAAYITWGSKRVSLAMSSDYVENIEDITKFPQVHLKHIFSCKTFPCRLVIPNYIDKITWEIHNSLRVPEDADIYRHTFPNGMPIFNRQTLDSSIVTSTEKPTFPSLLDLSWKVANTDLLPEYLKKEIESKLTLPVCQHQTSIEWSPLFVE